MKFKLFSITILSTLLVSGISWSQESNKCDSTKCNLQLNSQEIIFLYNNLAELDGRPTGEISPGKPVQRLPYSLGSIVLIQGRDMAELRKVAQDIDTAKKKIEDSYDSFIDKSIKESTGCNGKKIPLEKSKECDEKVLELINTRTPVNLLPISAKKLDLDHNNIPGSVISGLTPILTDLP